MREFPDEPLLDVKSVAAYLDVSVPKIYRLIRSGRLQAFKVGGEWRISTEAVRQFLEDNINVE